MFVSPFVGIALFDVHVSGQEWWATWGNSKLSSTCGIKPEFHNTPAGLVFPLRGTLNKQLNNFLTAKEGKFNQPLNEEKWNFPSDRFQS